MTRYFVSSAETGQICHGPFATDEDANAFLTNTATAGDYFVFAGEVTKRARVPVRVVTELPVE